VAAIREIGGIVNQINEIQSVIASAVEEQTATTNEIGRNVSEAAEGSAEIVRNVTGVARAAEEARVSAGDAEHASSELGRMATDLQVLVGRFLF